MPNSSLVEIEVEIEVEVGVEVGVEFGDEVEVEVGLRLGLSYFFGWVGEVGWGGLVGEVVDKAISAFN